MPYQFPKFLGSSRQEQPFLHRYRIASRNTRLAIVTLPRCLGRCFSMLRYCFACNFVPYYLLFYHFFLVWTHPSYSLSYLILIISPFLYNTFGHYQKSPKSLTKMDWKSNVFEIHFRKRKYILTLSAIQSFTSNSLYYKELWKRCFLAVFY